MNFHGSGQRIEARSRTFCSTDLLGCTSMFEFALVCHERSLLLRLSLSFRLLQRLSFLRVLALFLRLRRCIRGSSCSSSLQRSLVGFCE